MAVPSAYLTSTKNTAAIFTALQKASIPTSGFTHEFLKNLGFSSSGDRPIIPVLKAIGFLDQSGQPTELYRTYKDPALARQAMAKGIRAGYADLFQVDNEVHKKPSKEVAGIFARLSDKGDTVTAKMATTFVALASLADFESGESGPSGQGSSGGGNAPQDGNADMTAGQPLSNGGTGVLALRHDIHVHLPLSTDVAVYDAIFKSLRENLM